MNFGVLGFFGALHNFPTQLNAARLGSSGPERASRRLWVSAPV